MKYCADCRNMGTADDRGKFPCTERKSGYKVVSARMPACACFGDIFNSKRSETDRERYMRTSREYGYFIMTAIMNILKLPDKDRYIHEFAFLKDEVLPKLVGGEEWVDDYNVFGPMIVSFILGDDKERIANSLYRRYIRDFDALMGKNEFDAAIEVYNNMYEELKIKYGLMDIKLRTLK